MSKWKNEASSNDDKYWEEHGQSANFSDYTHDYCDQIASHPTNINQNFVSNIAVSVQQNDHPIENNASPSVYVRSGTTDFRFSKLMPTAKEFKPRSQNYVTYSNAGAVKKPNNGSYSDQFNWRYSANFKQTRPASNYEENNSKHDRYFKQGQSTELGNSYNSEVRSSREGGTSFYDYHGGDEYGETFDFSDRNHAQKYPLRDARRMNTPRNEENKKYNKSIYLRSDKRFDLHAGKDDKKVEEYGKSVPRGGKDLWKRTHLNREDKKFKDIKALCKYFIDLIITFHKRYSNSKLVMDIIVYNSLIVLSVF